MGEVAPGDKSADPSNTTINSGAGVVDDVVSQRRAGQEWKPTEEAGPEVERQGTPKRSSISHVQPE